MLKNFHKSLEELEARSRVDFSDSESTQSTPEEEKIRRIFATCDTDGDGFITSEDILAICKQLKLDFNPEEIMHQLGANSDGRVSFDDFLKRRFELLEVSSQINSARSSEEDWYFTDCHYWKPLTCDENITNKFNISDRPMSSPPDRGEADLGKSHWLTAESARESDSASHSLEASSSAKHESSSWEFDSGAHDLDLEQISLQRLIENNGISISQEKNDILEIANKFHQSAIHSVKQELFEVTNRLQLVLKERDLLEKQITALKRDQNRVMKELEKRRHRDCLRYEDRITELSTVIAELSEKLEQHNYSVFHEEDEYTNQIDVKTNNYNDDQMHSSSQFSNLKARSDVSDFESKPSKFETMHQSERAKRSEQFIDVVYEMDSRCSSAGDGSCSNNLSDIDLSLRRFLETIESISDKKQIIEFVKLEMDKLKYKLLHTQSQLDLVNLHLEESKSNAERLTVLLGKYEANNTGLQLSISICDDCFESWKISNDLKESEMGLLLASCRAAGLGKLCEIAFLLLVNISEEKDKEEIANVLKRAKDERDAAETNALQFIKKLYKTSHDDKFSKEDEKKIIQFRNQCQTDIAAIRKSLVDVEPLHPDDLISPNSTLNSPSVPKYDLENVVLMQELMALKEENAELKSQIFVLEKEVNALSLQLVTDKTIEQSYLQEYRRLSNECQSRSEIKCVNCKSLINVENVNPCSDQIHDLLMSLSQVTKNYELRVEEYCSALKALKKGN
ncbi:colorectal mutant cancer protein-like isoform X1, partial [Dinothrombium tinctorium]